MEVRFSCLLTERIVDYLGLRAEHGFFVFRDNRILLCWRRIQRCSGDAFDCIGCLLALMSGSRRRFPEVDQ